MTFQSAAESEFWRAVFLVIVSKYPNDLQRCIRTADTAIAHHRSRVWVSYEEHDHVPPWTDPK